MTGFPDKITHWADERLDALLAAPSMWGSDEAVEMQALLLLELRVLALRPAHSEADPRTVFDRYTRYLRNLYPSQQPAPLCELAGERFAAELERFRCLLGSSIQPEDPYQHADLVLSLEFRDQAVPSTISLTSYCDGVRRAARAFARAKDKTHGRVKREVEQLTDFRLDDIRVTRANGTPARATVLMERGVFDQENLFAETEVRDALQMIAETARWSDTDKGVSALNIDDTDLKTRAAVQTLRLLPRRDVEAVSIGGRLTGAPEPFTLRTKHESRCVSILAEHSAPVAFDRSDEIRGIDLDRGTVILGKKDRLTCYISDLTLATEIREVGVRARVRGRKFAPALAPSFVLVDSIELLPQN